MRNPITLARTLKRVINAETHTRRTEAQLKFFLRSEHLMDRALHSTESGVSTERYCPEEVIVSLTSYSKRVYDVALTIESIMQGSMRPNRIVLWLDDSWQDKPLPRALRCQQQRGLEIGFCKDTRSFKKLIPTIEKYPKATVITIDDDVLYDADVIERMVNAHIETPECVIAERIHRIVLGEDNRPLCYRSWKMSYTGMDISNLNFQTGVGGVLYPPHSLDEEVSNEELFMTLCPQGDDIWFWAMGLRKGTRTRKCFTRNERGNDFIENMSVQDIALFHKNITRKKGQPCANDTQLAAIFDHFKMWDLLKD